MVVTSLLNTRPLPPWTCTAAAGQPSGWLGLLLAPRHAASQYDKQGLHVILIATHGDLNLPLPPPVCLPGSWNTLMFLVLEQTKRALA